MTSRLIALATLAVACGEVVKDNPDAPPLDALTDAPGSAVLYRGMMAETPPVTFGGGGGFCMYTIVLKQIELQVMVLPSGAVVGGSAQNLNVEAVVEPCGLEPQMPSIAKYTFATARTEQGRIVVDFVPVPTNEPQGVLTLKLQRVGEQYTTDFEYHRTDLGPPFDWRVAGTVVGSRLARRRCTAITPRIVGASYFALFPR